jgi:CRP-like cAMP-binding protein
VTNPFIQKLSDFAELFGADGSGLEKVSAFPRRVPARTDLIREEDRPGPVFVVLKGWAQRYKILPDGTRQIVAFLMSGDCCDLHIGMLAEMDHSIKTVTPSRIATIFSHDMGEMLDRHRNIEKALYRAQLTDEGTLRAWIVSMGRRTSIERVAHLMCEFYLRATRIGLATEAADFALPLSQVILADALGMTPVPINRVLKQLWSQEILDIRRGGMIVTNPVRLAQIAGFDENYLHRQLRGPA